MKWLFALFLVGTLAQKSIAQAFKKEKVVYLDADGKPTKKRMPLAWNRSFVSGTAPGKSIFTSNMGR